MLPYFPQPFKDELLYSIIARYHRHICSFSQQSTLKELFGKPTPQKSLTIHGNLGALAAQLPPASGLTAERLAIDHTVAPYIAAFRPPAYKSSLINALTMGSCKGLDLRVGTATGGVQPSHVLQFCTACHEEALKQRGERFWRRTHQLPGVFVCTDHGLPLARATLPLTNNKETAFFAALDSNCTDAAHVDFSADALNLLLCIARNSASFLSNTFEPPSEYHEHVITLLQANNLASASRRVDQEKLRSLQLAVFAPLRTILPAALEPRWLKAVTQPARKVVNTFQCMLFGVLISQISQVPLPAVRRSRPTLANDPVFEVRLRSALTANFSLRQTARTIGVSEMTVRTHALRLGLIALRPSSREGSHVRHKEALRIKHRGAWIKLFGEEPGLSRTAMRLRLPATAQWLRRHDYEWFHSQPPIPKPRVPFRYKVDWDAHDIELSAALPAAASALLAESPPVRIRPAALLREIGSSQSIPQFSKKLPRTSAALKALTEKKESYRARRFAWAKSVLSEGGREPARWRIVRLAGLPHDWHPVVSRQVDYFGTTSSEAFIERS